MSCHMSALPCLSMYGNSSADLTEILIQQLMDSNFESLYLSHSISISISRLVSYFIWINLTIIVIQFIISITAHRHIIYITSHQVFAAVPIEMCRPWQVKNKIGKVFHLRIVETIRREHRVAYLYFHAAQARHSSWNHFNCLNDLDVSFPFFHAVFRLLRDMFYCSITWFSFVLLLSISLSFSYSFSFYSSLNLIYFCICLHSCPCRCLLSLLSWRPFCPWDIAWTAGSARGGSWGQGPSSPGLCSTAGSTPISWW